MSWTENYLVDLKNQRKFEEQMFLKKVGGDEEKVLSLWFKEVKRITGKYEAPKWLENARSTL